MKAITLSFLLFLALKSTAQNVGINNANPDFPLSFSNALGDKISLWGTAGYHYGLGLQSGLLQLHTDAPFAHIGFGYGSSQDFNERMRIYNEGPNGLELAGSIKLKNGTQPLDLTVGPGLWMNKPDNSELLGFIGVENNKNLGIYGGSGGWGFTYDAINSRVGIGNTNPLHKLDVTGDINLTGKLRLNGSSGTTNQVLKSNGEGASPTWQNSSQKQILFSTFFAGGSGSTSTFSPVSQSTITNIPDLQSMEFIMPYSGKVESLNARAITTFSTSSQPNNINIRLYKNGSPTSLIINFNSQTFQNQVITVSSNTAVNFVAGDKLCYQSDFTNSAINVKMNCTLGLAFD
jgi:hypothetical protein